jgi:hypothetical protein
MRWRFHGVMGERDVEKANCAFRMMMSIKLLSRVNLWVRDLHRRICVGAVRCVFALCY